jgi:hypothetical protein
MSTPLQSRRASGGAVLGLALVLIVIQPSHPLGHEHTQTHRKLTAAAFRLLNSEFLRKDPFLTETEIRNELARGVMDEDECIGVYNGRNWQFHPNYNNHFFEPGEVKGYEGPIAFNPLGNCTADGFTRMHAAERAAMLWEWAVDDYRANTASKRLSAFYVLGRVMHLLQDMTSAAHVNDDPHGKLQADCGQDSDDFETWGHCPDKGQDYISDYMTDSGTARTCDGQVVPIGMTCRLWWALTKLYEGKPQGAANSKHPVSQLFTEENLGFSYVRHVAHVVHTFTRFRARLEDKVLGADLQPASELTAMLRGPSCGILAIDQGLCEVDGGWTISGSFQEIGRTTGSCGRSELAFPDASEEWWMSPAGCTATITPRLFGGFDVELSGYAYIENTGGEGPFGFATGDFIPLRYGCTAADSQLCGDPPGIVTSRSKPQFRLLYGTTSNQEDPFEPTPSVGKSMLRIYGDVLYPTAVAFGAGLLQAFIDEVKPDDPAGPVTGTPSSPITETPSGGSSSTPPAPLCESWSAPSQLRSRMVGNLLTLEWSAVTAPHTTQVVEAGSEPGASDVASLAVGNSSTFAVPIRPGRYYIRVRASDLCNASSASNEVVVEFGRFPGAPTSLSARVVGRAVTLTWNTPSSDDVVSYVIEAGTGPQTPTNLYVQDVGEVTAFAVNDVLPGTYHVRVRAAGVDSLGPPSTGIWVTVP